MEEWRWIKGYENLYKISNKGIIKSYHRTPKIMKLSLTPDGYRYINLSRLGESNKFRVHRLVAQTFIENKNNLPEVNHIDEDKNNNCVSNLEWCTHEYNMGYGTCKTRNTKTNQLKTGKPIYAIYKDGTDYFFKSVRETCRELKLDRGAVFACLRGDQLTQKGYQFETSEF